MVARDLLPNNPEGVDTFVQFSILIAHVHHLMDFVGI